jgi:hypothetical protein
MTTFALIPDFLLDVSAFHYYSVCSHHRLPPPATRHRPARAVLFGQIAGGLAQPFFTNSPAKLAGEWFPVSERNLATTVASMCNPLGIALGQILPTLLVDATARDFAPLLMWQLIGIAALTGVTLLLFQPQPEFAPSIATRERRLTRADQQQRRKRYRGAARGSDEPFGSQTTDSKYSQFVIIFSSRNIIWLERQHHFIVFCETRGKYVSQDLLLTPLHASTLSAIESVGGARIPSLNHDEQSPGMGDCCPVRHSIPAICDRLSPIVLPIDIRPIFAHLFIMIHLHSSSLIVTRLYFSLFTSQFFLVTIHRLSHTGSVRVRLRVLRFVGHFARVRGRAASARRSRVHETHLGVWHWSRHL